MPASGAGERDAPWARALAIAGQLSDAETWPAELAEALRACVEPDAVGVFLCPLGNVLKATAAVAPQCHDHIGRELVQRLLPELYRSGLETPWDLFSRTDGQWRPAARLLQRRLLEPAGFCCAIGRFIRSRGGMVAGWVVIFSRSGTSERIAELESALGGVCGAAQQTLRRAIGLASSVGAGFPLTTPSPLSEREREIAGLAAGGLSDLNIAQQVGISEGTVGRHLHNIYRKLGIGSRLELAELLGVGGTM
jgi:DNA-binding CsgD family transcriptional regulator